MDKVGWAQVITAVVVLLSLAYGSGFPSRAGGGFKPKPWIMPVGKGSDMVPIMPMRPTTPTSQRRPRRSFSGALAGAPSQRVVDPFSAESAVPGGHSGVVGGVNIGMDSNGQPLWGENWL